MLTFTKKEEEEKHRDEDLTIEVTKNTVGCKRDRDTSNFQILAYVTA